MKSKHDRIVDEVCKKLDGVPVCALSLTVKRGKGVDVLQFKSKADLVRFAIDCGYNKIKWQPVISVCTMSKVRKPKKK